MGTNIFGDGVLTSQYPVFDDIFSLYDNVSGFFSKIKVDDDSIAINHAGHDDNAEDSHLFIKGTLEDHEAFIKIKNDSNVVLFKINHTGHVLAPMDITAPSVTSNTNAIIANQSNISTNATSLIQDDTDITALQSLTKVDQGAVQATYLATDNSLVQRNNTGTMFTILNTEVIQVEDQVSMYGDAQLLWIPQETVNGVLQNVPGSFVRVGRTEAVGAVAGDGIELVGRAMDVGKRNEVRITANDTAPSIEIQANKSNTAPYIRCTDENDIVVNEISEDGFSQAMVNSSNIDVIPGIDVSVSLKSGLVRHFVFLTTPWTDVSKDVVILLTTDVVDYEFNYFFTCEVSLNELTTLPQYTQSVVYVDRISKNVRKDAASQIRVVIKLELHNGENQLGDDAILNFTYNNQKMLV